MILSMCMGHLAIMCMHIASTYTCSSVAICTYIHSYLYNITHKIFMQADNVMCNVYYTVVHLRVILHFLDQQFK